MDFILEPKKTLFMSENDDEKFHKTMGVLKLILAEQLLAMVQDSGLATLIQGIKQILDHSDDEKFHNIMGQVKNHLVDRFSSIIGAMSSRPQIESLQLPPLPELPSLPSSDDLSSQYSI